MSELPPVHRPELRAELEQARRCFHELLDAATKADLQRPSRGTRWTNKQLLFHMLFGYLIVRTLRWLVRGFGHLPDGVSRRFARLLDAVTVPFDVINYWGSCIGALLISPARMGHLMDRVVASLQRHLDRETDTELARQMHFPTRWDPFFTDVMTLGEVYHYATVHFDYHRQQLTLSRHGQ